MFLLTTCLIPGIAQAKRNNFKSFKNLPDDAIVCYMLGEPVYKHEVEQFGNDYFIKKEFNSITEPDYVVASNHSGYYTESYIPSSHRNHNIFVSGQLVTYQFSQNDRITYMTEETAESFASAIESTSGSAYIISLLIAAIGITNPTLGTVLAILVGGLYYDRAQLASSIRAYTDQHQGVMYWQMSNRYGTFHGVHSWDGLYCIRYGTGTVGSGTYSRVTCIQCECGINPFSTPSNPIPVYPMSY